MITNMKSVQKMHKNEALFENIKQSEKNAYDWWPFAQYSSSQQCPTRRVFRYLMNISDEFLSDISYFPRNIKNYGQIKNLGQIFSLSLNHTEITTRPDYQSVKPMNIQV